MIAPPPTPKRPARIPVSPPAKKSAAASGRNCSAENPAIMKIKNEGLRPRFKLSLNIAPVAPSASGCRRRLAPQFRPARRDHRPEQRDQAEDHDRAHQRV